MKMKNFMLYVLFVAISFQGFGQDEYDDTKKKDKKNAFAVSFGTQGLGLEYARKLSPKINAKVVWHSAKIENYEQNGIELDGEKIDALINFKSSIYDIGLEWLPFTNSSFKLTAGLGIFSEFNLNGIATYTEDITVGTVTITKQDIGEIMADVSWSGTAPYVGMGFGRAIPKRRLGFGLEIGTYFVSSPDVNLEASNLLAPTADQEDTLREALADLKFIPRIQFRLAYKF